MEQKKNQISLWRKFDRLDNQPVAKGNGVIGENDFVAEASLWPSKKGQSASGKNWQVWNLSVRAHKDEERKLVAVPAAMLEKVLAMINGTAETQEQQQTAAQDAQQTEELAEKTNDKHKSDSCKCDGGERMRGEKCDGSKH